MHFFVPIFNPWFHSDMFWSFRFFFFFFLHLFYEQEILFNKINATEFSLSGIYLFSENTFFY